ncbi:MAG: hypothetical protein A3A97_01055 [Candidatus Terrybacteria bacterium RIFCSPLOWO2_01_FULL_40_23]|uniref:Uncharacterized protein n=1 Tax=Candidatus Terrybacteria bacterium RIFCSPLOWO2_01_FULL_40_23 TaxID=1802366 RepID=A0A1G2PWK5_9BACT|nr:MAG: hypothetical protein A3A97_01055 [Candidatus Terrybacteria bacterium RIFCSPLOWO2_01_FULL_40_23]
MLPNISWEFNLFSDFGAFLIALPISVGLILALLLAVFYRIKKGLIPRSFLIFLFILGFSLLFLTSVMLTILQYQSFMSGPIKYALPPYKPLSEYFLGYAFLSFWSTWIVGLVVTGVVSIYWWIVKKQSGGLRINSKEILIFMLFGALAGWPAVMVYVFFVFAMYIGALLTLNLVRMDSERRIPILKLLHRFIKDDEVRTPIMPYFILAAPFAFLLSPTIFKILGLTGLYIVPRLFY